MRAVRRRGGARERGRPRCIESIERLTQSMKRSIDSVERLIDSIGRSIEFTERLRRSIERSMNSIERLKQRIERSIAPISRFIDSMAHCVHMHALKSEAAASFRYGVVTLSFSVSVSLRFQGL